MKVGGTYAGLAVCVAVLGGLMGGSPVGGTPASTPTQEEQQEQQQEQEQPNKDSNNDLVSENNRDEKVFIILAQIQPTECTTKNATNTKGTCLPSKDCSDEGGTASGSCASGLGVCCILSNSCNSASERNNTYFVSPGGSDDGMAACTLTIQRLNSNICQIRLDFLNMELSQPNVDGKCTDDFLTVSSGVSSTLMICGSNTGQHIYYDLDPKGGAVKLTVDRAASVVMDRYWNIQVTQIACDSPYRAPVGCLQYHTRTTGTVTSFNYAGATVNNPAPATRQLSSMDYAICVRRADSYCGITWEPIKNERFTFSVSNVADATDISILGSIDALSTGAECKSDYIVIPGGVFREGNYKVAREADRYCGLGFPAAVTSTSQPFVLYVKTDHEEGEDRGNRGFKFTYRQIKTCE